MCQVQLGVEEKVERNLDLYQYFPLIRYNLGIHMYLFLYTVYPCQLSPPILPHFWQKLTRRVRRSGNYGRRVGLCCYGRRNSRPEAEHPRNCLPSVTEYVMVFDARLRDKKGENH